MAVNKLEIFWVLFLSSAFKRDYTGLRKTTYLSSMLSKNLFKVYDSQIQRKSWERCQAFLLSLAFHWVFTVVLGKAASKTLLLFYEIIILSLMKTVKS